MIHTCMTSKMNFRTPVEIPPVAIRIKPADNVWFVGSCFAQNVGERLVRDKMSCRVNPFGVLYNPLSVAQLLHLVASDGELPSEECYFESGGLWHCWLNDSSFSASTRQVCQALVEGCIRRLRDELPRLKFLFITLGTPCYYQLKTSGRVVGNCHKQSQAHFLERVLTVEETMGALDSSLGELWRKAPHLQVIFTVSPYRYAKYGFHNSQLGKAVLLLASDGLCRRYGQRCAYFPAYEIVLDELRDYRFYANDMLHPSPLAADYIYERFAEVYFDAEAKTFCERWRRVVKAMEHRPLHPGSEAHRRFVRQTLSEIHELKRLYPALDVQTECERLNEALV